MSSINYFIGSGSPLHRHILVVSSYSRPYPDGSLCRGYLCMESDYSKSIRCIFMIFTDPLHDMHGYMLFKFHVICMRIDQVTGAGTYKYDKIFSQFEYWRYLQRRIPPFYTSWDGYKLSNYFQKAF